MLINEDHIWIRRLSFIMSIYDLNHYSLKFFGSFSFY